MWLNISCTHKILPPSPLERYCCMFLASFLMEIFTVSFCSWPPRYVFAKTTPTGLTTFYALFLNSNDQTVSFEYRPEGLDEGSRSLVLQNVNIFNGDFHHLAVSVFGDSFALFVDGQIYGSRRLLLGALEDGPGTVMIGRRLGSNTRFQGVYGHH